MNSGAFSRQHLQKRFEHFDPQLCDAIAFYCRGHTVSDFGAGLGLYVAALRAVGCYAVGYDGTPAIERHAVGNVRFADLAAPCELPITNAAISIEVGEHIPPAFEQVFVANLCSHATSLLIVSWAIRGQRGKRHVNCKNPHELLPLFEACGWQASIDETLDFRKRLGEPYRRKVLLFRRDATYNADEREFFIAHLKQSLNRKSIL